MPWQEFTVLVVNYAYCNDDVMSVFYLIFLCLVLFLEHSLSFRLCINTLYESELN